MDITSQHPPINYRCAAIVLAAGKSTRMRSTTPKPLHPVCGLPVTTHVIRACRNAGIERIVVIVGHEAEAVKAGLGEGLEFALQSSQRGTGDAVAAASELLSDWSGDILILAGDAPLIRAETLTSLIKTKLEGGANLAMLTARLDDATGYGRIVRDSSGRIVRIVEHKDATPDELKIKEWNPSIYLFSPQALWSSLEEVRPNNIQGEFYLTDTVTILAERGETVTGVEVRDASETLGINTRVELAAVASILRGRILTSLMLSGVTVTDPANTYIDADVTIEQDTTVKPNTYLTGTTRIGSDCVIGPGTSIHSTTVGDGCTIVSSHIVDSVIEQSVRIGPFAHLRPGTHLGNRVKIGDFVELKNATLGEAVQVNHLSYIGDSDVGAGTNIGAGTITCNFDGFKKHRTIIGENAFVGSHTTLIAPVTVGAGVIVAAGSTLTEDVPADALAISRPQTIIKEQWAAKYRDSKRRREG